MTRTDLQEMDCFIFEIRYFRQSSLNRFLEYFVLRQLPCKVTPTEHSEVLILLLLSTKVKG